MKAERTFNPARLGFFLTICVLAGLILLGQVPAVLQAQQADTAASNGDTERARRTLAKALSEEKRVRARAARLQQEASSAQKAADSTAQQSAMIAAQVQQSEAAIATGEARLALIAQKRAALDARLAAKQEPIVHLTAALQTLSRRPLALSVLQPGSLRDLVHMRAVLSSALPQVEERTAGLRAEIERSRALEREARQAVQALQENENQWANRRKQLAALETRQRLASRRAGTMAAQETDRALALAEKSTNLGALVDVLDKAAARRNQLAQLAGPILRPPKPEQSLVVGAKPASAQSPASEDAAASLPAGPRGYTLPVTGRIVTGFGARLPSGLSSEGITLSPRAMAQVVAPAAGRVAFAGPYRGYGRIVIVEHERGWTSLVTGLLRIDAQVGSTVSSGTPLGIAGNGNPVVTLELRHGGKTFNPLEYLAASQ